MTCEQCERQLNALADGALPPLRAWQIRRHLAQCPACARAYAEIVQIGSEARAWRTTAPPAALAVRIALALPPQTSRMENTAMILERPLARPRRTAPRLIFAAVLCAAALALLALWPGSPGRPNVALADVERAVDQVNTVTATCATTRYVTADMPVTEVTHNWIRRNPPAIASVPAPSLSKPQNLIQTNMSQQNLWDERGEFTHEIAGTQMSMNIDYMIDTGARLTPSRMRGTLEALLNPSRTKSQNGIEVTPAQSEPARLEGHQVLRLVRHVSYANKPEDILFTETYYIDPITLRPIRIEFQGITAKTRKPYSTSVVTNFRYNAIPPSGVFDWSPPKGSRVEVTYRTSAGLYIKDKMFPAWPGGAEIGPHVETGDKLKMFPAWPGGASAPPLLKK